MADDEEKVDVEQEGDEAADEVPEMPEELGPPAHEPFSMKLFSVAKEQQSANGLRHNDHLRYRQYCTRRLRRLRNTLRWKNGKGRGKQVVFPPDFQDPRFLEFPLVCAERAWSYGVQLKTDLSTAQNWQPRWRLHSIRRFTKAAKWAEFLEAQCKRHGDQRTQREAEAYTAFMAGTLLLEKEEWEEALSNFKRCKKVCEHLALASDQAESALFKSHAQLLKPCIRECKYNLGQQDDDEDEDVVAKTSQGSKDFSGLSYRGQGLTSPPEKIKAQLLKCLASSSAIKVGEETEDSATVIDKYGALSAEFGDTLKDIHTDMIHLNDKDGESQGPSEGEWQLLEAFARELNICMNVERNLILLWNLMTKLDGLEELSTTKSRNSCRPEEGMRYCDLLKEDINNLLELPETSSTISQTLDVYITVALNCRCFFLALCHSLTGKTLESAALLDMLSSRMDDLVLEAALDEPLGRLHTLFQRIVDSMPNRVSQWRCRGLAALCLKAPKVKDQESEAASAGSAFPPRVKDIPCKPLLFDLAFPCIEPPDFEEILPKKGGGDGQRGSLLGRVAGGIGSRLGGIWGRK